VTVSIKDVQHNNALLLCWVSLYSVSHFISYYAECHYAECHYAQCHILFLITLNAIMLSVIMLNVIAPLSYTRSSSYLVRKCEDWMEVANSGKHTSRLVVKSVIVLTPVS
jgi:hypothetical protein